MSPIPIGTPHPIRRHCERSEAIQGRRARLSPLCRFAALATLLCATAPTYAQDNRAGLVQKMDEEIARAPTVNEPDHDFVATMVPIHRATVDLARLYLRTGKDPDVRRLAQRLIDTHQAEIRWMRGWQAKHQLAK